MVMANPTEFFVLFLLIEKNNAGAEAPQSVLGAQFLVAKCPNLPLPELKFGRVAPFISS
jgi:hypothetical protein